jgi:hypothetical protein
MCGFAAVLDSTQVRYSLAQQDLRGSDLSRAHLDLAIGMIGKAIYQHTCLDALPNLIGRPSLVTSCHQPSLTLTRLTHSKSREPLVVILPITR